MKKIKKDLNIKKTYKISLVLQVAIFFIVGVVITGLLAFGILTKVYESGASNQKEELASQISHEVSDAIKDYPAWKWLINYWYENGDKLELEYDTDVKTHKKAQKFVAKNKGFILSDATEEEVEKLSPEDQKTYAEIIYNWLLKTVNSVTKSYKVSFLYCASISEDYKEATFLLNGSKGDLKRGKEYGQAYVEGVSVATTKEQMKSLSKVIVKNDYIVVSGDYIDKYSYITSIGKRHYIVGVTFKLEDFQGEVKSQTITGVTFFVLLQLVLSVMCLILIYIYNLWPLKSVQKSVQKYSYNKDVEQAVEHLNRIKTGNEIEALAKDVSAMTESIRDYVDEIERTTAEKERIAVELNTAKQIQENMLPNIFPPFPHRKEIDVYASMTPAKEVGGDFYDYFFVDETHIALVMADVSGKGVPAALFMVIAKVLIKNRMLMGDSPSEALANVNNQLCDGNDAGLFVTVWLALIDLKTGEGLATNAGHEHPVLKRNGKEFQLIKYKHSPAVAVMNDMVFEEHSFVLKPGDVLYVYTDGVTEAQKDSVMFGEERMVEALNKYEDGSLEDVLCGVKNSIDEFVDGSEQFDDITMMGFVFNDYYKGGEENE